MREKSEGKTERIQQPRDTEREDRKRDASDLIKVVKWKNTNGLLGEINIYCLIDGIS